MEAEDISQAYMGHSCSCNNAFEKPEEQDPTICRASDDTAPATSITGCFDCSICLDLVVDPVVTLCGHLFCWPCIYKWMQVESIPHHQCPVCKAFISQDTVIPLYGRGRAGDRGAKADPNVPERPPLQLHHNDALAPSVHPHQFHHHRNSYFNNDLPYPPPSVIASLFHSTAGGLVGGLAISMLPWVQRHDGLTTYYARPYFLTSSESNPRLMRRQMRVENLLHQIWIFLLCLIVMCLLFF